MVSVTKRLLFPEKVGKSGACADNGYQALLSLSYGKGPGFEANPLPACIKTESVILDCMSQGECCILLTLFN